MKPGIIVKKQIEVIGHNKAVAESYLKFIKTSDEYTADNRHDAYIEWMEQTEFIGNKDWPVVDQIKLYKPI